MKNKMLTIVFYGHHKRSLIIIMRQGCCEIQSTVVFVAFQSVSSRNKYRTAGVTYFYFRSEDVLIDFTMDENTLTRAT